MQHADQTGFRSRPDKGWDVIVLLEGTTFCSSYFKPWLHMRVKLVSHTRLIALGISMASVLSSASSAADLSVGTRSIMTTERHVTRVHARRPVRDYDGTPVVFRPYRRVLVTGIDGLPRTKIQYAADAVPGAPAFYSNGEPILPSYPRGWPVAATERYRIMTNRP